MPLVMVSILAVQTFSVPVLVGLWDFPGIMGDAAGPVDLVTVHLNPSMSAAVVAHLDKEGISLAGAATRSCRWIRDLDLPASPRGCIFTESGYEIPSLAVFDRQGGWLRIALDDRATRYGWVQERGQFHALADLLAGNRSTYLMAAWDRTLYESPSSGAPALGRRTARTSGKPPNANAEVPYRAIGHVFMQGRLWLHVEILDEVCGGQDPRVIDTGWVPAQSPVGAQWAWFWSRGC